MTNDVSAAPVAGDTYRDLVGREHPIPAPQLAEVARHIEPESAQLMGAIIRAAADPAISAEKMSALYDLHVKMQDRASRLEFAAALARAQAKFPIIDRNGKIVVYSKADREKAGGPREGDRPQQVTAYALWEDVNAAIGPPINEEGFSLAFETETLPDSRIVVKGILAHRDGFSKSASTPPMQHDSSGSKNAVQAVMSTISYGKRMAAGLLINFTSRGEDNDGSDGAKVVERISSDQFQDLSDLLAKTETPVDKFCGFFKIEGLSELPASRFKEAMDFLNLKLRRQKPTGVGAADGV